MKEHKEREFAKCIEVDDVKISVNVEDIVVESSYTGPKLVSADDITPSWVEEMMEH